MIIKFGGVGCTIGPKLYPESISGHRERPRSRHDLMRRHLAPRFALTSAILGFQHHLGELVTPSGRIGTDAQICAAEAE
jgi:hypothetical protein